MFGVRCSDWQKKADGQIELESYEFIHCISLVESSNDIEVDKNINKDIDKGIFTSRAIINEWTNAAEYCVTLS